MKCNKCQGLMIVDYAYELGQRLTEFRCANCGARSKKCSVDNRPYEPTGLTKLHRGIEIVANSKNRSRALL